MPDRKFGRIAPKIPPHRDSGIMQFGAMLPKALKPAPKKVAWWRPSIPRIMGDNDKFGSCGPTSYANFLKLCSGYTMPSPVVLTSDEVLGIYEMCNPRFNPLTDQNDDGVVLNELYKFMQKNGPRGVNLKSTFAIDPGNPNNMKWALRIFGPLTFGVTLTQADMHATDAGQPWTLSPRRLPPIGGHAVTVYDYDDAENVWKAESWAQEQDIAYDWQAANTDEVHGFIHPYQFNTFGGISFTGLDEGSMRIDAGLI